MPLMWRADTIKLSVTVFAGGYSRYIAQLVELL